jgi:hypothetical protein
VQTLPVAADFDAHPAAGNARRVLRINPRTGNVREIGPVLNGHAGPTNTKFKWLRGILAADNAIYCIPANAVDVLKIQTFPTGEEPVITTIGGKPPPVTLCPQLTVVAAARLTHGAP